MLILIELDTQTNAIKIDANEITSIEDVQDLFDAVKGALIGASHSYLEGYNVVLQDKKDM
jgi:hypothetical protein